MYCNHLRTRGAGLFHDGSLRAEKIEYDDNKLAFEQFRKSGLKFFLGSEQQR